MKQYLITVLVPQTIAVNSLSLPGAEDYANQLIGQATKVYDVRGNLISPVLHSIEEIKDEPEPEFDPPRAA